MNWDRALGNWKQFTGKAMEKWGKLTNAEIVQINENREQLFITRQQLKSRVQECSLRVEPLAEPIRSQKTDWTFKFDVHGELIRKLIIPPLQLSLCGLDPLYSTSAAPLTHYCQHENTYGHRVRTVVTPRGHRRS